VAIFRILTEPVSYYTHIVSANRRNNEARAHIDPGFVIDYSVDLRIQMYTESVQVKYMENSPQNIRGYTDIFYSACCPAAAVA